MIESSPLAQFIASFTSGETSPVLIMAIAVVVHSALLVFPLALASAYLDRKLGADVQMRIGPNRVGPVGILQSLADTLKAIAKQDVVPSDYARFFFKMGPFLALALVFAASGPIPFAQSWALSDLEWGSLYSVLMLLLVQLVLFLAGHSSGSHWAIIGAYRSILVLASFAVPALLALLSVVVIAGGASFSKIIAAQGGAPWRWLVFNHPPTILAFFVMASSLALWNLSQPFDTPLAGSEISGGISAEYSGFRLACLRALRHCQTVVSCALLATLFLGGWNVQLPAETFGRASNLIQYLVFVSKIGSLAVVGAWFRWSMVRLRGDQIIYHAWKILVPMGVLSVALSAVWMTVTGGKGFLGIP